MEKRFFFVLGPESSGTRMMTEILVRAGCFGDYGHKQRLDGDLSAIESLSMDVVFRRSLPYAGRWPNLHKIWRVARRCGYRVYVVVMSRDWNAMAQSQVRVGHTSTVDEALRNIRRAYREIFRFVDKVIGWNYILVNYEAMQRDGYRRWVLHALNLSMYTPFQFVNGNAKYYGG